MLVSNNPYELVRLAGAGMRPRLDTGTLGVFAARVRSPGDVSQLAALELAGQAQRFGGLLSWSAPEFEVRSSGPVEVGLDGEALVLEPPLRFESLPGALRVRLPSGAGRAPYPLTTENLGALVQWPRAVIRFAVRRRSPLALVLSAGARRAGPRSPARASSPARLVAADARPR